MTVLPMFPLGSVLFPAMPTALRVFEERYIVMLSTVLGDDEPRFGIVLIERGSEVGGGEQRFDIGTVARITRLEPGEGMVGIIAVGTERIAVTRWLDDDPYPSAEVRTLAALEWDDDLWPLRERAERLVRRTLAQASEFSPQQWPADIVLDDDPVAACWQLAGIAPVGALDHVRLLRSSSLRELLDGIIDTVELAAELLTATWPDEIDGLDGFPASPDPE